MQQLQTLSTNRCIGEFLNPLSVNKLTEWQVRSSKSEYNDIANTLADLECNIEEAAVSLGKIEIVSDQDRRELRSFSLEMFKAVKRLDEKIIDVKALPNKVWWRQQAYTKLEHLAIRLEDIAETAALASSKKFTKIILTEIQSLKNETTESYTD